MKRIFGAAWFLGLLVASAPALQATTVVLPTDEQLVEKTPLIIRGRVLDTRPVERNGGIYTETTVLVEKTLKGSAPGGSLLIRELGGALGDRMTVIFGSPAFTIDESVLLFLAPGPEDAYRVRDMFVGKFSERTAQDGTRLWYRGNEEGVTLLDRRLKPMSLPNIQRRADEFENFITAAGNGSATASASYKVENPVLRSAGSGETPGRLQANFTLIADPEIYRWSSFDGGAAAEWRHVSSQPGYSGGGVNEARAGMAAWTSYSAAKIRYQYGGAYSGTPGGHKSSNGVNEIVFNDVTNEIDGTYSRSSGGVVGIGGFNRATNGGTWYGPFNADATHAARAYASVNILEGNLVIQDGVTPQNGVSSNVLAEIIAHEFGHTLGFGHSEDGSALMFRSVTGGGPSLRSDDQIAARWLYPNGSGGGGTPEPTPTVPTAPANLVASAMDSTRVSLQWSDRANNEASQRVYVAVGSGTFEAVGDVAANQTSVGLSGLNPVTRYRFRVTAINGAGESSPSNIAEITMPVAGTPLSAAFTFSPSSPEVDQTIQFTDGSSGSIGSWRWTFGDGTSSTVRSPQKRYASPGTYAVKLTVTDATGSASVTRNVVVRAQAVAVNAAFTFSPSSPLAGQWITFSDQSTGSPTSWEWTYGDGTTSNGQSNPQKRYASPGTYTVTLRVSNGSSSSSTSRTISVGSSVPATPAVVAAFDASMTTTTAGRAVSFTDRSSGSPTSWKWSFGDGATSTSRNPSHVYTAIGTYNVSLTAANGSSSSVATKTITVKSEPRYRSVLPVAAQTSGASSTDWRTELSIHNSGSRGVNVDVKFLPADGGTARTKSVFVSAGSTASYGNALRDLFAIGSGSGALSIEAVDQAGAPELNVASRTFTGGSSGTYGQFVPGEDGDREVRTMYLTGVVSSGDFRTNLGLANASSSHLEVTVTLLGAAGETVGNTVVGLGGGAFRQMSLASLFPQIQGKNHPVLSARLSANRTDRWYGYASVVDNRSQDPVFVRAIPPAGRVWTIPAIGRTAGAEGTYWRSDVTIYNPTSSSMTVSLQFLAAGKDNSSAPSRSETIPAGSTIRLNDVLSRFGLSAGSGALRIVANAGNPIVASRTYTTRSDGGSFGQSIDAVAAEEFSSESVITGIRADGNYRTNIGLANGSTGWANVTLTLVRTNGSVIGTHSVALPARGQTQVPLGSMFPGVNMSTLGSATVRVTAQSGEVVAYGSVIDNNSGDPVFILGD